VEKNPIKKYNPKMIGIYTIIPEYFDPERNFNQLEFFIGNKYIIEVKRYLKEIRSIVMGGVQNANNRSF